MRPRLPGTYLPGCLECPQESITAPACTKLCAPHSYCVKLTIDEEQYGQKFTSRADPVVFGKGEVKTSDLREGRSYELLPVLGGGKRPMSQKPSINLFRDGFL